MEIKAVTKPFAHLTPFELYAILRLRNEIFVVEQNCVFQDADNKDQGCHHLMLFSGSIINRVRPVSSGWAGLPGSINWPNYYQRSDNKYLEEGEHEFNVYDKKGNGYVLNSNKHLLVTLEYDFDTAETILTAVEYTETVSTEEYKQLQSRKTPAKDLPKGRQKK